MAYSVDVTNAKSGKKICTLERLSPNTSIREVKDRIASQYPAWYRDRQSLRLEKKGKSLKDSETLTGLDLGPQVGWSTVFVAEYAGPLFIYLLFYLRPSLLYENSSAPVSKVVHYAAFCHTFHYAKRILETLFVHRFSHSTMPLRNLFKNCTYYWGFAAFMAYFINHPLYTAPGETQVLVSLAFFAICEPDGNPLTNLFNLVSCPNYTYEVGAWLSFGLMTQCLAVILFMICGFAQMTVWAKGKHRRYKSEFKNYPRGRTAIVPFLL